MSLDPCRVEWIDSHAQVVHISSSASTRRPALATELSIHRHQIAHRAAGAELSQAEFLLLALDRAAQYVAVEREHLVEIYNSEHHVIDLSYTDHDMNLESGG